MVYQHRQLFFFSCWKRYFMFIIFRFYVLRNDIKFCRRLEQQRSSRKSSLRHHHSIEYVQINEEYSFKLSITQEVYLLQRMPVLIIREGINRITAKLVCPANPANLTKFYSINVTGMNRLVPKQYSAVTSSNTTNSSSLINHLSIPTNSAPSGGSHRHHSIYDKGHANAVETSNHHVGPYVNCRIFILSRGPCL